MPCYFFSGQDYIRVFRGDTGPGRVDGGYPLAISAGWHTLPASFDLSHGINSSLYDDTGTYLFNNSQYIRMTRGSEGPGTPDPGYPKNISDLKYPAPFNEGPFDAALYSGSEVYFFKGQSYMRASRSPGVLGPCEKGYPASLGAWGWEAHADFGASGICAALNSGSVCYFFEKFGTYAVPRYIRVTRGATGPGTVDAGYPQPITVWGWGAFGNRGISSALYSGPDASGGGIVFTPWP